MADVPSARCEHQAPLSRADHEVATALRLVEFNWRLLASVAGFVLAWLVATQFYIEPAGYVVAFALATLCGWFGLRNARSGARANPRVFLSLIALAQMTLAIPVMLTLTYVATSAGFPLQDARLLAWDRALGFEFKSFLDFINGHPELLSVLAQSYSSITLQMILLGLVLPLTGCYQRGAEAICAYILALLVTTCISAFVPAIGVYHVLGLQASDFPNFEPAGYYDTLRDAPLVRAGLLRKLNLPQLVGVVTFPSFHAAAAVLYMWSFWPLRWLRLAAIPWNVLMIVATPLGGGHYLVDILAGVAVSTVAIVVTTAISAACSTGRLMSTARLAMVPARAGKPA
ncbi:phosphatase PAP2 family protein [Bradyrhizobium sp. BR13661]|uniref:phosphatase PAP2 family protein n=2 Tax=Pseudomonadota TaxID=1224 RepID=UPI002474BF80|nr:phosphatase PAP2 family protein [Bradyrhizobium sp. BR13661]